MGIETTFWSLLMRFENCIRVDTKLRLQNIISKAALFYGSEM
jgi:hypothetical protein